MPKWTILGSEKCSWCDKAKNLLTDKGIEFEWFNINRDLTLYSFLTHSGFTTVPQVFHNGRHIGGFEATQDYLNKEQSQTAEGEN